MEAYGFKNGACGSCSYGCTADLLGDGTCDSACNTDACRFDQGDCLCTDECYKDREAGIGCSKHCFTPLCMTSVTSFEHLYGFCNALPYGA